MDFACPRGVTFHYRRDGSGQGPALVFVNSLGTDLRSWDQVVAQLGTGYRVLRYDPRGHGLSDTPPGPYSLADHADDLHALLEVLGIANPILVGLSVGGMVALEYASKHPERVRALVLGATAGRIGTPDGWNARIAAVRGRGLPAMAGAIVSRWFAADFAQKQPAVYQGLLNMLARMPAEGYSATCAALRDGDLRSSLPAIRARALVLAGSEDVATPPEQVRQLAQALPGARFELIAGAGHLLCVEQPGVLAAKIARFVQELEHV